MCKNLSVEERWDCSCSLIIGPWMIIWPILSIFEIFVLRFGDVVMEDDIIVYVFEAVCPLSVVVRQHHSPI